MIKLTIEQSFDFYLTSLGRIGMHILKVTDKEIEYQIFEEFETEYPAALSKYTLDVLEECGIIDTNIVKLSRELQTKLLIFERENSVWNVEALKDSSKWKEILQLADEIKGLINQKWSNEELDYLRGNK